MGKLGILGLKVKIFELSLNPVLDILAIVPDGRD